MVGHGLGADLGDAAQRHHHAGKPEPAHDKKPMGFGGAKGPNGDGQQEKNGAGHFPCGKFRGQRIKNRQPGWKKEFCQILNIGKGNI